MRTTLGTSCSTNVSAPTYHRPHLRNPTYHRPHLRNPTYHRPHLRNPTYHCSHLPLLPLTQSYLPLLPLSADPTCPLPGGEKCVVDVMHDVGALLVDGEHSGARCVPAQMWAG